MPERNPQAAEMAHESMVRNLAAQAQAIWPQERELLRRLPLPAAARVLDVGCGTGEFERRAAEELPAARFLGIDLHAPHLALARERCRAHGERIEFRVGDAFELDLPDRAFDLAVCRHLLQAVPQPERVLSQLARVTRPGGWLHLVAEDYAMLHFHPTERDVDRFFLDGPCRFAERTGTDLRSGRRMFTHLRRLGLVEVAVHWVVVDTVRVPRETVAAIFVAWRDGYASGIARETGIPLGEVVATFDDMIAAVRDPDGYGVWQLPVVQGRVPER